MSSPLWQALLAADAAAASAAAAAGCSPRALKACVGTALALVAVHHLLLSRRGAAAAAAPVGAPDDAPALAAPQATRAAPPAAAAAARPPARVCVATPGVIFAGPADVLAEGQALALAEHAARAIAALAAVTDVYLITQVAPGDGAARAEAAARESLHAAGVVGSGAGAVPPHRALFCTTQVGRIALVRQIVADEKGVHVDGCTAALRELARFGTRLVHVADAGDSGGPVSGAQAAVSLRGWVAAFPGLSV